MHHPGGAIRSRGTFDDQDYPVELRVIGGTGAFAGARGTFEVVTFPDASQGHTYQLQLP
jgi:hypothetical protein